MSMQNAKRMTTWMGSRYMGHSHGQPAKIPPMRTLMPPAKNSGNRQELEFGGRPPEMSREPYARFTALIWLKATPYPPCVTGHVASRAILSRLLSRRRPCRQARLRAVLSGPQARPQRRRDHRADRGEAMVDHLERAGFVVMQRPPDCAWALSSAWCASSADRPASRQATSIAPAPASASSIQGASRVRFDAGRTASVQPSHTERIHRRRPAFREQRDCGPIRGLRSGL